MKNITFRRGRAAGIILCSIIFRFRAIVCRHQYRTMSMSPSANTTDSFVPRSQQIEPRLEPAEADQGQTPEWQYLRGQALERFLLYRFVYLFKKIRPANALALFRSDEPQKPLLPEPGITSASFSTRSRGQQTKAEELRSWRSDRLHPGTKM